MRRGSQGRVSRRQGVNRESAIQQDYETIERTLPTAEISITTSKGKISIVEKGTNLNCEKAHSIYCDTYIVL